ncbi:MAG: hypothetical protein IPM54_15095 [Polyangiaceae bacterium]|nr:hypothetical protein [Polyangiaceae bacterium]
MWLASSLIRMVHNNPAKRKDVNGVRRGTTARSIVATVCFAALSLVPLVTRAQAEPPPKQQAPAAPVRLVLPPLPPAGKTPPAVTAPPPLPKPFPLEVDLPSRQASKMDLAGYRGGVFLRDSSDEIRFHLRGNVHVDFHSFFGSGKDELAADAGGVLLSPRLALRRARIEVAADLSRRWFGSIGLDFGTQQPLTNPMGGQPSPANQTPAATSDRFAGFQAPGAFAALANAYIDYTFLRQLHVMIGQHQAPFSLENRTAQLGTTWLERNMAIRSFVVPNAKEMGLMLWGDINDVHTVGYEFGVFLGDGPNRPQVDAYPDFIGRIFARPWARSGKTSTLDKVQIGLSFHRGSRDPKYVAYDYPGITTAFGWTLWSPRYLDSMDRLVRVLPAGGQTRIGGELRIPVKLFDVRAEAYWVSNGTREAVDGFQLQNTERFGSVEGVGYYLQVSAWPWGDAFVTPDPGFSRPPRLDLTKTPNLGRRGVELSAIFGGVEAGYDGAARDGSYDVKTPGAPGGPPKTISIHEIGVGATYWHSQFVRASVNYLAYHTVGSDVGDNLAMVPSNLVADPASPARASTWHHELGMRLGLSF